MARRASIGSGMVSTAPASISSELQAVFSRSMPVECHVAELAALDGISTAVAGLTGGHASSEDYGDEDAYQASIGSGPASTVPSSTSIAICTRFSRMQSLTYLHAIEELLVVPARCPRARSALRRRGRSRRVMRDSRGRERRMAALNPRSLRSGTAPKIVDRAHC